MFHIGASIKDLGRKWFGFTLMRDITATELIHKSRIDPVIMTTDYKNLWVNQSRLSSHVTAGGTTGSVSRFSFRRILPEGLF